MRSLMVIYPTQWISDQHSDSFPNPHCAKFKCWRHTPSLPTWKTKQKKNILLCVANLKILGSELKGKSGRWQSVPDVINMWALWGTLLYCLLNIQSTKMLLLLDCRIKLSGKFNNLTLNFICKRWWLFRNLRDATGRTKSDVVREYFEMFLQTFCFASDESCFHLSGYINKLNFHWYWY